MLRVGRLRVVLDNGRGADRRRSSVAVLAAAGMVVALGAGVGFGVADGRADATITACVADKGGAARIIRSGSCRPGEHKVRWSKVGPVGAQGPAGLQGTPGTPGTPGAQGSPGPAGVEEFGDLVGLPCTREAQTGTIELSFDAGGVAVTRCRLAGDGPVCGDGVTEGTEACDDGNDDAHDGCTNTCQPASCGDSVVRVGAEQCDTGGASAGCDADCTVSYCGDGVANPSAGEPCDTGGSNTGQCDLDCTIAVCGDGVYNPQAGEQCDDGNQVNGDGCSVACLYDTP